MDEYREIFERIPSVKELNSMKDLLVNEELNKGDDIYWCIKSLCVYDTDSCDSQMIISCINRAISCGVSLETDYRKYLDLAKILVTLYSQTGQYEKVISVLTTILRKDLALPDWVYHDYVSAEMRTNDIAYMLEDPNPFLEKLSKNTRRTKTVKKKQRNIFKEFLVEADVYLQTHQVQVNDYALSEAAEEYGLIESDGWRLFISTVRGKDPISIPMFEKNEDEFGEIDETTKQELVRNLFPEEVSQPEINRELERKYSDVISRLTAVEVELEEKRKELEEKVEAIDQLFKAKEEYVATAERNADEQQKLISQMAAENQKLKEEIREAQEKKETDLRKIQESPVDEVISKIHLFSYTAQVSLTKWLTKTLPYCAKDWWDKCVIGSLSYEQRERAHEGRFTVLSQFDLAALLRIMSKNWTRFKSFMYMAQSDYECLSAMFELRNRWAHMNASLPDKEIIITDLNVLAEFMGLVGCSRETIKEVEQYSRDLDKKM